MDPFSANAEAPDRMLMERPAPSTAPKVMAPPELFAPLLVLSRPTSVDSMVVPSVTACPAVRIVPPRLVVDAVEVSAPKVETSDTSLPRVTPPELLKVAAFAMVAPPFSAMP